MDFWAFKAMGLRVQQFIGLGLRIQGFGIEDFICFGFGLEIVRVQGLQSAVSRWRFVDLRV